MQVVLDIVILLWISFIQLHFVYCRMWSWSSCPCVLSLFLRPWWRGIQRDWRACRLADIDFPSTFVWVCLCVWVCVWDVRSFSSWVVTLLEWKLSVLFRHTASSTVCRYSMMTPVFVCVRECVSACMHTRESSRTVQLGRDPELPCLSFLGRIKTPSLKGTTDRRKLFRSTY